MDKICKFSGIYQIRNKINNKRYIGKSNNITLRWNSHINNLLNDQHPNRELQKDFNIQGITVFEFLVLDLVDNLKDLTSLEQKYINTLDLDYDYNRYNATSIRIPDKITFINYINENWFIPKNKIYLPIHRKEILDKARKCKIIDDAPSRITFNRVVRFMIVSLGYSIKTKRFQLNNKQYRYKLITDYNENL
jgi:group I intron endonuclease